METWVSLPFTTLWRHAFAAIPLVLLIAVVTRWLPCRPATRHLMWVAALVWMLIAPFLPQAPGVNLLARLPLIRSSISQTNPSGLDSVDGPANSDALVAARRPMSVLVDSAEPSGPSGFATRRSAACPSLDGGSGSPTKLAQATDPRSLGESLTPFFAPREYLSLPRKGRWAAGATPRGLALDTRCKGEQPRGWGGPLVPNSDEVVFAVPRFDPGVDSKPSPEAITSSGLVHSEPSAQRLASESSGIVFPADGFALQSAAETSTLVTPTSEGTQVEDWREWVVGLSTIRSAIEQLPPIPTRLWMGGAIILALSAGVQILRFKKLLKSARRAPAAVRSMVREAADQMGLRRHPEVRMLNGRLSPMIWCGRKLQLILPAKLWEQLDESGRRAVVLHELAHVRRKDHWVTWLDAVVGVLYWWYPLVWWIRGRVRAEAEDCCDAWVTSLLPHGRRAYAEALLKTKRFVWAGSRPVPAVALGMENGRARRFARRLTMVMTSSVKPRLSMSGIGLVLAVATTGWLVTPARSCPPKGDNAPCAVIADGAVDDVVTVVASGKISSKVVPVGYKKCANCKSGGKGFAGVGYSGKPCADCTTVAIAKGCAKCAVGSKCASCASSSQCKSCAKCAEGAECASCASCASSAKCKSCVKGKPCSKCKSVVATSNKVWTTFGQYMADKKSALAFGKAFSTPDFFPVYAGMVAAYDDDDDDDDDIDIQKRLRKLERQLERLTDLIEKIADSREKNRSGPEVRERAQRGWRATRGPDYAHEAPPAPRASRAPRAPRAPRGPRAPRAPRALRQLYDSLPSVDESNDGTIVRAYKVPQGKREAVNDLMARSDVPVLMRPLPDGIEFHGTKKQHRVFGAFLKMIFPESDRGSDARDNQSRRKTRKALKTRKQKIKTKKRSRSKKSGKAVDSVAPVLQIEPAILGRVAQAYKFQVQQQLEVAKLQMDMAQRQAEFMAVQAEQQEHAEQNQQQMEVQRLLQQLGLLPGDREDLIDQADSMRDMAEELRDRAETARDQAQSSADDQLRSAKSVQVEELLAKARDLDVRSDAAQREAEFLALKAKQLQRRIKEAD